MPRPPRILPSTARHLCRDPLPAKNDTSAGRRTIVTPDRHAADLAEPLRSWRQANRDTARSHSEGRCRSRSVAGDRGPKVEGPRRRTDRGLCQAGLRNGRPVRSTPPPASLPKRRVQSRGFGLVLSSSKGFSSPPPPAFGGSLVIPDTEPPRFGSVFIPRACALRYPRRAHHGRALHCALEGQRSDRTGNRFPERETEFPLLPSASWSRQAFPGASKQFGGDALGRGPPLATLAHRVSRGMVRRASRGKRDAGETMGGVFRAPGCSELGGVARLVLVVGPHGLRPADVGPGSSEETARCGWKQSWR